MLAAISRIDKSTKFYPCPCPWQKVVILKNQGGSVFTDGSRHGGMCIFFFLFNNKYVMLENTKKGVINMGTNFNDLWNNPDFITEDEKEKINFEVALIGKLIEARESKGLSQNKPLGYRLDIVPCE